MNRTLYLLLALFFSVTSSFSQLNKNRVKTNCGDESKCGPDNKIADVIKIIGPNTQLSPFNKILHIETTRNYIVKTNIDYGTVSFISPTVLITANHVVVRKKFLKEIKLCSSNIGKDQWITFNKNEFEIFYFSEGGIREDLAVIKLLNTEKSKQLYKGKFELSTIDKLKDTDSTSITGFPCYFANTPGEYDTLITRSIVCSSLDLKTDTSLIGYNTFTCSGDSGGPLWFKKDDSYYIVGIHHGGPENILPDNFNMSVRLNNKMIIWLNEMIK